MHILFGHFFLIFVHDHFQKHDCVLGISCIVIGPGLLSSILRLTVYREELKFLKYLVNSRGVDVNGEHLYVSFCLKCYISVCIIILLRKIKNIKM